MNVFQKLYDTYYKDLIENIDYAFKKGDSAQICKYAEELKKLTQFHSIIKNLQPDSPEPKYKLYINGYFYFPTNNTTTEGAYEEFQNKCELLGINIENAQIVEFRTQ